MSILKIFFDKLKRNELYKNIFLLISGNGLSQIIPLLFYPLIARLYSPENFGVVAVLMSIYGILLSISTGRYEFAILLPEKKVSASNLFNIGLSITIILCVLMPLITLFFKLLHITNNTLNDNFYWYLLLFIPVFAGSLAQLSQGWVTRYKLFSLTIKYLLISNILSVGFRLIFGILHFNSGLILSFYLSQIFAGLYFFYITIKLKPLNKFKFLSKPSLDIARIYQNFPKHNLPNSLVNTFSTNLPIFILSAFFSNNITGQFSIATGLIFKPILIYTSSVSQVLSQKIAETKNNNLPTWPIVKSFLVRSILLSVLPGTIIVLFAPFIFKTFLGPNWSLAGELCRYIVPWSIMVGLAGSLAFIPNVFGYQYKALIIDIVYMVLRLLALFIGAINKNAFLAIGLFSLAGVLVLGYQILWYRKILKKQNLI